MTLAGFVVFTSLLVNYFCMKYQYDARSDGGEQECPADFVTLTVEEQYATAETNEEPVHGYCDTLPLAEQLHKLCQRYWKAQALAQFWLAAMGRGHGLGGQHSHRLLDQQIRAVREIPLARRRGAVGDVACLLPQARQHGPDRLAAQLEARRLPHH